MDMTPNMVALVADDGRTWTVNVADEDVKIKGLGVFNPAQMLKEHSVGGLVVLAGKELTISCWTRRIASRHAETSPNHWRQGRRHLGRKAWHRS